MQARQAQFEVPDRGGNRFVRHSGLAAPYMYDNVSTDVPAPPAEAAGVAHLGFTGGDLAFANLRWNSDGTEKPDFVFNQEAYRRASIMIVGLNYGTGSSRSTAVTLPLAAWGVKAYIGQSFGPIFVTNALAYGVVTVQLPRPTVDRVAAWVRANPGVEMTVDLQRLVIELPGQQPIPFTYNERFRNKLLNGLDDMEEMEPHLAAAETKREEDLRQRPWVYNYHGP
ncbi:MAG: 3-isopropylmalate dehydratase small subunit [Gemmatimonadetes bacterium]|nr:3-isopropylmalate dehydratase small subunit [Gemmatimonadota bacterium]